MNSPRGLNNADLEKLINQSKYDKIKYFEKLINGEEGLMILLSPVSSCNLNCIYCYLPNKNNLKINKKIIEKILDIVIKFKNKYRKSIISIILHGYEPLQLSLNNLKYINNFIYNNGWHELNSNNYPPIILGIQTNGVLLNEKIIEFLYEWKWKVGVSLDGPKDIHDFNRPFPNGLGSYDIIMKNLNIYKKYFGEMPYIISVLTRKHLEKGSLYWYTWVKENNIKGIDLHFPLIMPFKSKNNILPKNINLVIKYYKELYDLWIFDTYIVKIEPLYGMTKAILTGIPPRRLCWMQNGCYRIINVNFNGEIGSCGRTIWKYNDINSINNLEELIIYNKNIDKIFLRKYLLKEFHSACSKCKYFNICQGGCPAEGIQRYFIYKEKFMGDPKFNNTIYCNLIKELYKYIERKMKELRYL